MADSDVDPTESERPGQGVAIRLFPRDDWDTPVRWVHNASRIKWLDELNGPGFGEFTVPASELKAAGRFGLDEFGQGHVVRCYLDGVARFSWRIEEIDYTAVTDEEDAGASVTFRGRGLLAVLEHGVVMSELKARDQAAKIPRLSPDERAFTFAADQYDASAWPSAVETTPFEGSEPSEWPDANTTSWIAAPSQGQSDPDDSDNADVSLQYFRHTLTLTGKKLVEFFAACVGEMEVYVNGASVLTTAGNEQTATADVMLPSGTHQLAVRYRPDRSAPNAMCALSYGELTGHDVDDNPIYDWLGRLSTSWKALTDVYPPPAFTPGRVLRRLIIESRERADVAGLWSTLQQVRMNFTDTTDSTDAAWTSSVDRYWANGTDILSVALELAEAQCEVYMSPYGRLMVYDGERGSDKSTGAGRVEFRAGYNVRRMSHSRRIGLANHLLYRYEAGWGEHHRNAPTAGYREGFVSLGTADSNVEAKRVTAETLNREASATQVTSLEIVDRPGARPYRDFKVGDYVAAPHLMSGVGSGLDRQDDQPEFRKQRVISIGVEQDDAGNVTFAPELVYAEDD